MALKKDHSYTVSLYLRAPQVGAEVAWGSAGRSRGGRLAPRPAGEASLPCPAPPQAQAASDNVTVALVSADGATTYAHAEFTGVDGSWRRYEGTLVSKHTGGWVGG